ncbi:MULTISPECIES: TatD family hydrolase [Calditerrivibrio]|uniref:TatD family deoxyribonuclease n=1 Tax=Calditerrivibrio nitroreducens TaxID=477976 RepID=A0A2J6WM33_9BACT|nr:MAG: TatD family deoxyribonuclease [Calditerrivibrio nitroreducens]
MIIEKLGSDNYKLFQDELKFIRESGLFFTDTHAHLHFEEFKDIDRFVESALENAVKRIVTIGIDLDDSIKAKEISEKYKNIYYTLGFHPHDAKKFSKDLLVEFQKYVTDRKMLAVGEIGLDFYRNLSDIEVQIKVFEYMLEFARINRKPVIIHNRDASDKVSEVIDSILDVDERIGIIHCFNGDKKFLKWALDKGFFISYAGPITFKKEDELRGTLKYVPIDRVFVETDCPYLTPSPMRGKMNEPAYVVFNAYTISRVKDISLFKLAEVIEKSFLNLFGKVYE